MPWGDRTGPMGMGPMTGRGAGYCAGYGVPGYMNPIPGRGFGMGFGRGRGFGGGGRGWRHRFYATGLPGWARFGYGVPAYGAPGYAPPVYGAPTPEAEREFLEGQVESLQSSLAGLKARLDELSAEQEAK
ncbi:MAG: DUF5320 domain-containing protein [Planctomycetes bacterium]|nr:DUF5320 domain-containing protein [Planctomycetota bacterium]